MQQPDGCDEMLGDEARYSKRTATSNTHGSSRCRNGHASCMQAQHQLACHSYRRKPSSRQQSGTNSSGRYVAICRSSGVSGTPCPLEMTVGGLLAAAAALSSAAGSSDAAGVASTLAAAAMAAAAGVAASRLATAVAGPSRVIAADAAVPAAASPANAPSAPPAAAAWLSASAVLVLLRRWRLHYENAPQ